jgi:hypothetical protein
MSKYMLVVDLPDDDRCRCCPMNKHPDKPTCFCMALLMVVDAENRPTDCPLIPVDRVMDRLMNASNPWNRTFNKMLEIIRDELGVTE